MRGSISIIALVFVAAALLGGLSMSEVLDRVPSAPDNGVEVQLAGDDTVGTLDQWRSTSTPFVAMTPRTYGKDIYAPGTSATTSDLAVLNLPNCNTIDTDASGNFKCGTDATGAGGGGSGSVATSSIEVDNQVAVFSSNGATPATIDGDTGFTFDGSTDLLSVGGLLSIKGTGTSTFSGGIEAPRVGARYFVATSTTASQFPYASSTALTVVTGFFTNLFIGVDTIAEYISDTAGAMFTGNTETDITITYDDTDNTIDAVVDTLPNLTGTLDVDSGGTGAASLTDGGVLLGSGTGAITPMAVLANGEIIVGDGTTDPVALAAFESSTGDLAVTAGGTGVSTLTDGGVLVGNGAADLTVLSVGTNGQILVGSTGVDPVFATLNCADNLTCTTGAGTLEIDLDGDLVLAGTATSTFAGNIDAAGDIEADQFYASGLTGTSTLAGLRISNGLTMTGVATGCATFTTGVLSSTGVACGSGAGASTDKWATTTSNPSAIYNNGLGNVGIGTSTVSATSQLHVATSTGQQLTLSDPTAAVGSKHWSFRSVGGSLFVSTSTDAYATSTPAALQVQAGQGLFVGTTTNSGVTGLAFEGTAAFGSLTQATGGSNNDLCISASNVIVEETTGVCVVSSKRFKHDIETLSIGGLQAIEKLRPVTYVPNDDDVADHENTQYGFIAEEVAEVDPHLAKYGQDGLPRTLDDRALLALAIKAIQEQQEQIDALGGGTGSNKGLYVLIGLLVLMNLGLMIRLYGKR